MAPRKKSINLTSEIEVAISEKESDNVLNLDKSSVLDKIFFADVEKVSAKDLFPDYDFNSYNNTLIKVNDGHRDIIVNNVSEDYLLLPNKEIFPTLEENLKKFGDIQIKREVKNNSEFSVNYDFLSKDKLIQIAGTDIIFPRITIENSYNSKTLFTVNSGYYRCICQNGLCLPVVDATFNTILSHSKGNLDKIIEATLEGINQFLISAKDISGEYEVLMEKKVKNSEIEDYVEKILKGTKSLISFKEDIIERLKKENTVDKVETNLFSIYNAINYMLQPNNNPKLTIDAFSRRKVDEKILDFTFGLAV